jgi:hypothetical protein
MPMRSVSGCMTYALLWASQGVEMGDDYSGRYILERTQIDWYNYIIADCPPVAHYGGHKPFDDCVPDYYAVAMVRRWYDAKTDTLYVWNGGSLYTVPRVGWSKFSNASRSDIGDWHRLAIFREIMGYASSSD